MERFNLKELKELENKEQHRVEISTTFAALDNLVLRWILIVRWKL
jgi:hypothetical protein